MPSNACHNDATLCLTHTICYIYPVKAKVSFALLFAFLGFGVVGQSVRSSPAAPNGAAGAPSLQQTPVAERPEYSKPKSVNLLSAARDVTQIAFFILIGAVTVLTYKKVVVPFHVHRVIEPTYSYSFLVSA